MPLQRLHPISIAVLSSLLLVSGVATPAAQAQRSGGLPTLSDQIPTPANATLEQAVPGTSVIQRPAQTVPTQPIPTQAIPESSYTLGAGDIVDIQIFRVPQYSGTSQVQIDGALTLPLVGKVNVEGLNLEEVSTLLSSRYAQYLKRPIINLSLSSRRQLQVGIAGEVSRPGSYNVQQGETDSSRLSQLIETAGGITQAANISQIQVRRPQGNGALTTFTVNLLALIRDGDLSQDLTLRDGDQVFIPTAQVPLENSALIADASFASDSSQPINIAIIGEVYRPGPYTLEGTSGSDANSPKTVTNAIQVAGGIKPRADIRKVQVVRPTREGTPQVFEADLWQLINSGDLQQDAILQAGDTVFVPTAIALTPAEVSQTASASFSPDTIQVNVVGEVQRAGTLQLPPNTPLSQAILAAGGFDKTRANRGEAELVRLQDDGTVVRETISVDFAEGINEENNPVLRNNDVVIVNRNGLASFTDTLGTVTRPLGGLFSIFRLFNIDLFD